MKFSANIPDDLLSAIDERAAAAGVTRTDWVRGELERACNPGESDENPDLLRLRASLDDIQTDRDRLAALVVQHDGTIAALTGDRDRLLAELTTMKAELDAAGRDRDRLAALVVERDRLAAELKTATDAAATTAIELAELRIRTADDRETIRRLEGDIHWSRTKIDELTPRLLAETVEEGRRWWQFWKK